MRTRKKKGYQIFPFLLSRPCICPSSSLQTPHPLSAAVLVSFLTAALPSWPRDQTRVTCIAGGFFPSKLPGKPTWSLSFLLWGDEGNSCCVLYLDTGSVPALEKSSSPSSVERWVLVDSTLPWNIIKLSYRKRQRFEERQKYSMFQWTATGTLHSV